MQSGDPVIKTPTPETKRHASSWCVQLENARADSESPEVHAEVSKMLGMDALTNVRETLGAYIRGEDGSEPIGTTCLIDPMQKALLDRHGIDPPRFLRVRRLDLGFSVVIQHTRNRWDTSIIDDTMTPRVSGITFMDLGIRHFAHGAETAEVAIFDTVHGRIPDTIAEASVGRRLSDLVRHGLEVDPVVTGVERLRVQTIIKLQAGASPPSAASERILPKGGKASYRGAEP